ncbi:O-antigen ligase family protein [Desulforamulus ferrireducens]|uniref:O-antigen ligase-related domain-containing protein n=1 Tax=Desulforamulus ferrireducens TaxID=1833852 RepID=A0A1S6J021_9FIRM|nr:O-antigen ligase family protein [Desulforamulus ferrireducens]AQS60364.1 hypothetical protein B0537_15600 [Desulforamulus ferrireducens]
MGKSIIQRGNLRKIDETQDIFYQIPLWGFMLLLFLAPYFQGLFFSSKQSYALLFSCIILACLILWKYQDKKISPTHGAMFYAILCVPILYTVSAFSAVNRSTAMSEIIENILYFVVFYIAASITRNIKDSEKVIKCIYFSSLGVALAGLASAAGLLDIEDGFILNRIYSTFQYPNALASFLSINIIFGLYNWLIANDRGRLFYTTFNVILLTTFLGTRSNGGLIFFAIGILVYLIGSQKEFRLQLANTFIISLVCSGISIYGFLQNVIAKQYLLAWIWLIIGITLAIFIEVIRQKFGTSNFNKKLFLVLVTSIIISGVIGYICLYDGLHKEVLEQLRLRNATERAYFFKDAITMIMSRPLLGWGGGGWQEAYRTFQSYLYDSNQVHSYYLQIGVEIGLIGLTVIIIIWITALRNAIKLFRMLQDGVDKMLIWSILIGICTIGAHATMDFNLSFAALTNVLYTGFGMIYGLHNSFINKKSHLGNTTKPIKKLIVKTALLFGLCTISIINISAYDNWYKANMALAQGRVQDAYSFIETAKMLNPLDPDYHILMAQIYKSEQRWNEAELEALQAVKKGEYSSFRNFELAKIYYENKKWDDALLYCKKSITNAPYQVKWYEGYATICTKIGLQLTTEGKKQEALRYFKETEKIPTWITQKMNQLSDEEKKLWNVAELMTITPYINLQLGISQMFTGDLASSENNLLKALDSPSTKENALLWLAILKEKIGLPEESGNYLKQIDKSNEEMMNLYRKYSDIIKIGGNNNVSS